MNSIKRRINNEKDKKRILVVDDHPVVREGLAELLGHEPTLVVGAKVGNAAEALRIVKKQQIDLAIIDILLKNTTGIQVVKKIKVHCPNIVVLIFSMSDELRYVKQAFEAGVKGYILKDELSEKIIEAIKQVLAGKIYLSKKLIQKFSKRELDNLLATDAGERSG